MHHDRLILREVTADPLTEGPIVISGDASESFHSGAETVMVQCNEEILAAKAPEIRAEAVIKAASVAIAWVYMVRYSACCAVAKESTCERFVGIVVRGNSATI